jgi:signal transduction histidine kinase
MIVQSKKRGRPASTHSQFSSSVYCSRPERDRELGATGLGLGLSIAADCIDAIKGDIRVESTPGQGTTFLLELPCTAPG